MKLEMELADFLKKSDLSIDEWEKSGADWSQLSEIANDFIEQLPALTSAAEQISSRLRTFNGVHSVRWRIKDVDHLLKKIIRKKLEDPVKDKWASVSIENYFEVVTDLVGVRALHLFKDECVDIDASIRKVWELCEDVLVYIRKGDQPIREILDRGGLSQEHNAGYRSIHYIVQSQPERRVLKAEIQVRTIFQEGWSEIDHKVKYPDHSDNQQITGFLNLFNVLAGSADEMGTFVKNLMLFLKDTEEEKNIAIRERESAVQERDEAMADIAERLNELDALKKQDGESQAIIKKLKVDMNRLKASQSLGGIDMLATFGRGIPPLVTSRRKDSSIKTGTIAGELWNEKADMGELIDALSVGSALKSLRFSNKKREE